MYVCICNAVTEKQIQDAMDDGVEDLWGLQRAVGVAAGCGSCRDTASEMLSKRRGNAVTTPQLYVPRATQRG